MKNWKILFLNVSLVGMILLSACSNGNDETPSDEMKGKMNEQMGNEKKMDDGAEMNSNEEMEMDSNTEMNDEEKKE